MTRRDAAHCMSLGERRFGVLAKGIMWRGTGGFEAGFSRLAGGPLPR
jgi:hypothetical protein